MVEPELTEVGELHSLTDWQVSDASEEAELDEFCSRGGTTRGDQQIKPQATRNHNENKGRTGWEGYYREGDRQTDAQKREGREKQRVS